MKYEVIIEPLAELDLREAISWYNNQQVGLGDKFLNFVDQKLKRIEENPQLYQKRFNDVRIGVVDRFPYVIHFKVKENKIIILSFYCARKNPQTVSERFK